MADSYAKSSDVRDCARGIPPARHCNARRAKIRTEDDPSCRCEAHHALAGTLTSLGELDAARQHFEAAVAAYDERRPQRSALGSDLGVFSHVWYSHTLWLLGRSDQARLHAEQGIALANRLDHPYSRTLAHAYASLMYQWQGDIPNMRASAETVMALSERHRFAYYSDWARILLGWADGYERRTDAGIALIQSAFDSLDGQRAQARRPYFLSLLADAHNAAGRRDRALTILHAAIGMAAEHDDVWWNAELLRMKGELEASEAAEASFERAIDIARAQGSRALELRSAVSLARLWQRRGQPAMTQKLLGPLVISLSGADARDLSQARELLSKAS